MRKGCTATRLTHLCVSPAQPRVSQGVVHPERCSGRCCVSTGTPARPWGSGLGALALHEAAPGSLPEPVPFVPITVQLAGTTSVQGLPRPPRIGFRLPEAAEGSIPDFPPVSIPHVRLGGEHRPAYRAETCTQRVLGG